MRKSREEAAATRQRIVESASRRFRENGIAETGLSDLMQAAGLETQGGFYKHFESKQQLLEESLGYGFTEILERLGGAADDAETEDRIEAIVSEYLSPKHRSRVAESCPLSAMGTELGRLEGDSREVVADGLKELIALVARQMKGKMTPDRARKRATAAVAAMVGGMMLSRIANNTQWSNSILAETRNLILQRS
jgi:TetR/AcrR family transcriptional repressor of nem operon